MKRILITGASSGVGQALAGALASAETELLLTGRREDALNSVAQKLQDKGARVQTYLLELADSDKVRQFGMRIAAKYPSLDVLINNAAVIKLGHVKEANVEDLDWQYAVNLKAPVILTQCLLDSVRKARGQFVFINSMAGLKARRGASCYAATKHGLKAVADSLREEVAGDKVSVLSVFLARVNTPMQERVLQMEGGTADLSRFLQPHDVATSILQGMQSCQQGQFGNLSLRAGEEPKLW